MTMFNPINLQYCVCNSNIVIRNNKGKEICATCGKPKMPVSPGQRILTRHIAQSQRTTNLENKRDK